MLEDLGHEAAAREIEAVVAAGIRAGRTTRDLGGTLTTSEVGDSIAQALAVKVEVAP
jgi:isocitrate/isopropylmalate dehydrogenase